MLVIDEYSFATLPLEMYFNDTNLSVGTSFIFQHAEQYYLITNWHNLSGKDPFTAKHLSPTLAEPNQVRVWWTSTEEMGKKEPEFIPIRDEEGNALWFTHPKYGRIVDVVALPVSPPNNVKPYPLNLMKSADLSILIGMDVFVLGYPSGISRGGLPVWKRASIATEPDLLLVGDDLQVMLIDTASRPGMSGSPVIRRSWVTHLMANGGAEVGNRVATKFLGVYSGRIGAESDLQAQLGIVWPAPLIGEIIDAQQLDAGW